MRLLLLCVFFTAAISVTGQDCFYQLQLSDSGSDGLNGGEVTVIVDRDTFIYTLDEMNDDGRSRNFFFPVDNGDPVTVGYSRGAFPEEVGFRLLDNNDSLLYVVEAPATDPDLFSYTAACRACAPPPLSSIELFRVRSTTVDIRFRSVPGDVSYRIEYGEGDFDPSADDGTEIVTRDTMLRVSGLSPETVYQFYVATICTDPEETTVRRGPFRVRTPIQRDLGITALRRPFTRCQPGDLDSVTVGITNFGGEPQQFIRLDFRVNGEPGGVNFPFDGIYTGVVGVDSTEFFTFDTRVDLRQPGRYEIEVFTLLEDDQRPVNDTFRTTIVTLPRIATYPYLESFEDGDGFWIPRGGGDGPSSWERARPRGTIIDRAGSGSFAYVTDADATYNDDELSYLPSPCFDFSGFDEDPFLSFLMAVDTEEEFDGLYLEASTDEGATWSLVERNRTGINWYNNPRQQVWDGSGGLGPGYAYVGQQLTGFAGRSDVRFRFVFASDGDTRREGVAIDNIRVTGRQQIDYAAVRAELLNDGNCIEDLDTLRFTYTNLGREPVDFVNIFYRLNGVDEIIERAPAPQLYGQSLTTDFDVQLQFGTNSPGQNLLEVWVEAEGDDADYNDTLSLVFDIARPLPFAVDFDDRRIPRGWELPADAVLADRAGFSSVALTDNLSADDPALTFSTAYYGPVQEGDELTFSFGQRDAAGAAVSGGIDRLEVIANINCGEMMPMLLSLSDVPADSTFTLDLGSLAGENLSLLFRVTWASGDFFVGFDDIEVRRCPENLDLRFTTVPPSGIFADDGTAYVLAGAGLAPYSYDWSNGDTSQSADSLSVAEYTVTVTDAVGCTDQITVDVNLNATATTDPNAVLASLVAYPNPTAANVEVRLDLQTAEEVHLEVFDVNGRRIVDRSFGATQSVRATVELDAQPSGIYLLRIRAGTAWRTLRIVKR